MNMHGLMIMLCLIQLPSYVFVNIYTNGHPPSYFLPFEIFNVLKLLVNNEVVICIKFTHKCLNYVMFI
jgi:hypothetical protein